MSETHDDLSELVPNEVELEHVVQLKDRDGKPYTSAMQYHSDILWLVGSKIKAMQEALDVLFDLKNEYFSLSYTTVQNKVVKLGEDSLLPCFIYSPLPTQKKERPSGLVIDETDFYLQVKQLILWDRKNGKVYLCDYSYHFGLVNRDKPTTDHYHFRYDREVPREDKPADPRLKPLEHLHVHYKKPHFPSSLITLLEVLDFIESNWDRDQNGFDLAL